MLAHYPGAEGCRVVANTDGTAKWDDSSYYGEEREYLVEWEATGTSLADRLARIAEIVPIDEGGAGPEWWLIPKINGQPCPSRLMTWWAFLYALSILARYKPGPWSNALRVDASELAVPIEATLEVANDAIPSLVLAALLAP